MDKPHPTPFATVTGDDYAELTVVESTQGELPPEPTGRATAVGTADPYCHVLIGTEPYRHTDCGQRLSRQLTAKDTHQIGPCPNGHPSCPKCAATDPGDPEASE